MVAFLIGSLDEVVTNPHNQALVGGSVTGVLAGVVVWLAKSYRDDMASRAGLAAEAHKQMLAEFKAALSDQRSDFRAELAAQRSDFRAELAQINTAVDGLTASVQELTASVHELKQTSE
jgi:hypothetical protein